MMTDDMALLREYAQGNSEEAFATLVSRHVNLVYSVARRQFRDTHLAEEVTQTAFIILARKAGSLDPKTILPAWLCRTAQYAAADALRNQHRRQRREQESYMESLLNQPEPEPSPWIEIAPLLDIAMARLGEKDHSAIVLRFFEGRNLKEVGAALGVSENTAKTRVSRALEKLRKNFAKRGLVSTTAIIAGAISANSIQAAPAALAKSVTAVAMTKGAAASASTLTLTKGALKLMAWTKAKTAVVAGVCALLAAATTTTIIVMDQPRPTQGIPKNWSVLNDDAGQWSATNGVINGHSTTDESILASGREYQDVTISAIVSTTNREASLALRMQDANNGYIIIFAPSGTPREDAGHLALVRKVSGQETILASYHGRVFSTLGPSAKITVTARGALFEVRLNDVRVIRVMDTTFATGLIGLRIFGDADYPCDSTYSNLTFY